jgi:hypothetical protein
MKGQRRDSWPWSTHCTQGVNGSGTASSDSGAARGCTAAEEIKKMRTAQLKERSVRAAR